MNVIRILSAEVAGRIAAGEVVERPASVMKELVENSIDAGARRIRVFAEQGGQKLLQVIDDGCGMNRQDALLCLEAHATSKIRQESDVGQIHTLGFRGEALPSISSVSRFHLQTRQKEALAGTEVLVNYGRIEDVQDCGAAPGTNIKVSYIFGNLPARRKFLKSPATEDSYLEESMLLLALSRPDIAFELSLNKRLVIQVGAAQDIASRAAMLLGKEAFAAMLPVDYSEDQVRVYGYVSKPGFTRSSRQEQRVIVNGRAASSATVYFGIRDAYDRLIPKGRYPAVILYIELEADRVDVNIHPTKHEVRFRDSHKVSAIIAAALRQALRSLPGGAEPALSPAAAFAPAADDPVALPQFTPASLPSGAAAPLPFNPPPLQPAFSFQGAGPGGGGAPATTGQQPGLEDESDWAEPSSSAPPADDTLKGLRILSRLGKKHLLAEASSGLVVVDLAAAQQRILFERLLANLKHSKVEQQQLLMPISVDLSPDESRFLLASLPQFQSLGFSLEHFGGHSFLITALPASMPEQDFSLTLRDIIDDLRSNNLSNRQNVMHLAQTASRHAARVGSHLQANDLQFILTALTRCQMPYSCPAGKPVMLHISYAELSKRFKQ